MKDYETKVAQHPEEFAEFLAILQRNQVRSYLEIGSQYGGSLWQAASALPQKSKVVSIDSQPTASLRDCIAELNAGGYFAHLLACDSTAPTTVRLASLMAPFDCVFIDGNHTLKYVTSDWLNYGSLGRMIAFHDIAGISKPGKGRIEVPQMWDMLRKLYKHIEIIAPGSRRGIGVLWRY